MFYLLSKDDNPKTLRDNEVIVMLLEEIDFKLSLDIYYVGLLTPIFD